MMEGQVDANEAPECRICRCTLKDSNLCVSPCRCNGAIHKSCLKKWYLARRKQSQNPEDARPFKYCEVCKESYARPVLDELERAYDVWATRNSTRNAYDAANRAEMHLESLENSNNPLSIGSNISYGRREDNESLDARTAAASLALEQSHPNWDTQLDPFNDWLVWIALGRTEGRLRTTNDIRRPYESGFAGTRVAEDLRWIGAMITVAMATFCGAKLLQAILSLRSPLLSFFITVWIMVLVLMLLRCALIRRNRRLRDQGLPVPQGCCPWFSSGERGRNGTEVREFELVNVDEEGEGI